MAGGLCTVLLLLLLLVFYVQYGFAEDFQDFSELSLEELLNVEIYSPSKTKQNISRSPNAIYIITAEDIKKSGVIDIVDLLRRVPGIDVGIVNGNSFTVSGRGFNAPFSNKMLVLLDGRSIYSVIHGSVLWGYHALFLENIERIEVIRGPAASLYGANAVNGVVSIITKEAGADKGFYATVKSGNRSFHEEIVRYSEKVGELSFRFTIGYLDDDPKNRTGKGENIDFADSRSVPKATFKGSYDINGNNKIHFNTGWQKDKRGGSFWLEEEDGMNETLFQILKYEKSFEDDSSLYIQGYYEKFRYDFHGNKQNMIAERKFERSVGDIETQYEKRVGIHHFVFGGNYRHTKVDQMDVFGDSERRDNWVSGFVQNQSDFSDALSLTLSLRYEKNYFLKDRFSPRVSLVYEPFKRHIFRVSYSKAYQSPTFTNNYFRLGRASGPVTVRFRGSRDLKPEKVHAVELGYRTNLFGKVGLNIETYYNSYSNLTYFVPDSTGSVVSFQNYIDTKSGGIETSLDIAAADWWNVKVGYTFQHVFNASVQGVPEHKFNLINSFRWESGTSLDSAIYYVGRTFWADTGGGDFITSQNRTDIDEYWRTDIRVAQTFWDGRAEIALVGQNLFDKFHSEVPGVFTNVHVEVERLLYTQLSLKF